MKPPPTQRRPIRPKDFTQNAKHVVDVAAGNAEERFPPDEDSQARKEPPARRPKKQETPQA